MATIEVLKEQGWYFTKEGFDKITDGGKITNVKSIIGSALDIDLRDICGGGFPEDLVKGKVDSIKGNFVVQILKIRNVSAPKANEDSKHCPRMLRIVLSDGQSTYSGLEFEHISQLKLDTLPGTKLCLKNGPIKISHNLLMLGPANITVLGGKVDALIEKWEAKQTLAKHARGVGRNLAVNGPPPWIPFGKKIQSNISADGSIKSVEIDKEKEQANAEFETRRNKAIAEALKVRTKKVFGGGNKSLLDAGVQKIVNHGFTEEQAEYALKLTRNNVDRALKNLQRREENGRSINPYDSTTAAVPKSVSQGKPSTTKPKREEREPKFEKRKGRNREEDDNTMKPSGKLSLFDYLEDKLPSAPEPEKTVNRLNTNELKTHSTYRNDNSSRGRSDRGGRSSNTGYSTGSRDESAFSVNYNSYAKGRNDNKFQSKSDAKSEPKFNDRKERNYDNRRSNNTEERHNANQVQQQPSQQMERPPRFQKRESDCHPAMSYESPYPPGYQPSKSSNPNVLPTRNNSYNDGRNTTKLSHGSVSSSVSVMNDIIEQTSNMSLNKTPRERFTRNDISSRHTYVPKSDPFFSSSSTIKKVNSNLVSNGSTDQKPQPIMGFRNKTSNDNARNMIQTANGEPSTESWKWCIGDKCLAKYWEDNTFYNAEVTAVSDKTCVVRFSEYGNYEEILKDHCLPVTEDSQGQPLNSKKSQNQRNNETRMNYDSNKHVHLNSSNSRGHEGNSRGFGRNRDRQERPNRGPQHMYVPPAQRNQNQK